MEDVMEIMYYIEKGAHVDNMEKEIHVSGDQKRQPVKWQKHGFL